MSVSLVIRSRADSGLGRLSPETGSAESNLLGWAYFARPRNVKLGRDTSYSAQLKLNRPNLLICSAE